MHPQWRPLTICGTVPKESDGLDIMGMTFDSKITFASIFTRFPEQLLKDLVSWRSPGKYSMIDHFLGDAFGFFSCQFWSTVLQCGALLPIHTLNYWTVQSVVPVFWKRVCLSVTVYVAVLCTVTVLCMLYKKIKEKKKCLFKLKIFDITMSTYIS